MSEDRGDRPIHKFIETRPKHLAGRKVKIVAVHEGAGEREEDWKVITEGEVALELGSVVEVQP